MRICVGLAKLRLKRSSVCAPTRNCRMVHTVEAYIVANISEPNKRKEHEEGRGNLVHVRVHEDFIIWAPR